MIFRSITRQKNSRGFVEKTLEELTAAFDHAATADALAADDGFLQRLDPRVKVCGILLLIIVAVSARGIAGTSCVLVTAIALAWSSRIPWKLLAGRVWIAVLIFTGAIALPAIFITPGHILCRLPLLNWPITNHGTLTAARLILRAETTATLALLLVLCTPWTHILKALAVFRVPVIAIVILGMTHRYIFLLLNLSRDLMDARRARLIVPPRGAEARRIAASNAGVLLGKSLQLSSDVFDAMQARGYRGEPRLLDDFQMTPRDWFAAAGFAVAAAASILIGLQ